MDHYNFHTIGDLAGTQLPYMLAILVNLMIASAAGLMFQLLWRWQYSGDSSENSALRRAASVALPPVVSVYAVVVVITNISVSIQLAVLLTVVAAAFTALLVLSASAFNPSERDRLLLSTTSVLTMISADTVDSYRESTTYQAVSGHTSSSTSQECRRVSSRLCARHHFRRR